MVERLIVTGFLGAGKSALVGHLAGLTPWEPIEGGALTVPVGETRIIAAVDAANLALQLGDTLTGDLVQAQIRSAGTLVITRSDLVDPAPAAAALAQITDAPQIVAPRGKVDPGALVTEARAVGAAPDLSDNFSTWAYRGGAALRLDAAEAMVAVRPAGIYRMSGEILLTDGGLSVEITGRQRETRRIAPPAETRLRAVGAVARFDIRSMDIAFAEAAAASQRTGIFGYR